MNASRDGLSQNVAWAALVYLACVLTAPAKSAGGYVVTEVADIHPGPGRFEPRVAHAICRRVVLFSDGTGWGEAV